MYIFESTSPLRLRNCLVCYFVKPDFCLKHRFRKCMNIQCTLSNPILIGEGGEIERMKGPPKGGPSEWRGNYRCPPMWRVC